jgi:hypothetical protein
MDNDGDYLAHFLEMPNTPPLLPSRRGLIPAAASLPLIPRPNHPVATLRLRVFARDFFIILWIVPSTFARLSVNRERQMICHSSLADNTESGCQGMGGTIHECNGHRFSK